MEQVHTVTRSFCLPLWLGAIPLRHALFGRLRVFFRGRSVGARPQRRPDTSVVVEAEEEHRDHPEEKCPEDEPNEGDAVEHRESHVERDAFSRIEKGEGRRDEDEQCDTDPAPQIGARAAGHA
jgi:hypothetical protein